MAGLPRGTDCPVYFQGVVFFPVKSATSEPFCRLHNKARAPALAPEHSPHIPHLGAVKSKKWLPTV